MPRLLVALGLSVLAGLWVSSQAPASQATASQAPATAAEAAVSQLPWRSGPAQVDLARIATLSVPAGLDWLDSSATERIVAEMGNRLRGQSVLVAPRGRQWYAVAGFVPLGWVDPSTGLDADAVLASLREAHAGSAGTSSVTGWAQAPRYEPEAARLTWGVELADEQRRLVNYTTAVLGRRGAVSITLVAGPQTMDRARPRIDAMADALRFVPGERHGDRRPANDQRVRDLAAVIVGDPSAGVERPEISGLMRWVGLGTAGAFALAALVLLQQTQSRRGR